MCILAPLLLAAGLVASPPPAAFGDQSPVGELALAESRGTALLHPWVRDVTGEQAALDSQSVAEIMRTGNDNWFADVNVQQIANAGFSDSRL